MTKKDHILFQYTVSTFIILTIVSVILGLLLTKWTSDLQIRKHIDLYPQIVSEFVSVHTEALVFLNKPVLGETNTDLEDFIGDIKTFGYVDNLSIWDISGTVLWSYDKNNIGKQLSTGPEYARAVKGSVAYKMSTPDEAERAAESDCNKLLEIYIPVKDQGKIIAVVELYENMDVLYAEIHQNVIHIYELVTLFGIIIYGMFFMIFYSSQKKLKLKNEALVKTQEITILSLASLSETRDNETGAHIIRTKRYMQVLAEYLKQKENFKHYLKKDKIDLLVKSSPLHDIGKVGVPDSILLKPGKLTAEEFEEMKKHTVYGYNALEIAEKELGSNSFLDVAREIAYTHHEKWDGSGYPRGLKGNEIPISGRLMAIADVYDALISKRVYKNALTHEEAKAIIVASSGSHFDPEIVNAFIMLEKEFYAIAMELKG